MTNRSAKFWWVGRNGDSTAIAGDSNTVHWTPVGVSTSSLLDNEREIDPMPADYKLTKFVAQVTQNNDSGDGDELDIRAGPGGVTGTLITFGASETGIKSVTADDTHDFLGISGVKPSGDSTGDSWFLKNWAIEFTLD